MMAHVVRAPGVLAFILYLEHMDLDVFIYWSFVAVLADYTH